MLRNPGLGDGIPLEFRNPAPGKDLRAAQAAAYAAVECIQFEGAPFRRDIAAKAML